MVSSLRHSRTHRGMTLVELLMVIAIVTILLAVIAPLMRITTQDRRLREAARQVNAYMAGAQARASERGRPVYVQMERQTTSTTSQSLKLSLAEVPPPYTGTLTDSRVTSIVAAGTAWTVNFSANALPGNIGQILGNVSSGSARIRFNYQGHLYPVNSFGANSLQISNALGNNNPAGYPPSIPSGSPGLPFQIYGAPIPSSAAPLTLPYSTAIDFTVSGAGRSGTELAPADVNDQTPVEVIFSPTGGASAVRYGGVKQLSVGAAHFLIGRNDRSGAENLADPNSIWISVNPTTGIISTTDNSAAGSVATAREYAHEAQNLGGR